MSRTNEGRVGGMFEGAPSEHTGRSDRPAAHEPGGIPAGRRTDPRLRLQRGRAEESRLVPKSAGRHVNGPIEIGTGDGGVETYAAEAVPLEGEERDRLYQVQGERDPAF